MAKLLMSTSQNEEKQFTRPHPNKVHKHWLDQCTVFYNFVLHVRASYFAFVILAYMNDKGYILRTFKNAGEFCSGAQWSIRTLCIKIRGSVSQLCPHVST